LGTPVIVAEDLPIIHTLERQAVGPPLTHSYSMAEAAAHDLQGWQRRRGRLLAALGRGLESRCWGSFPFPLGAWKGRRWRRASRG
jgi:hypothetical protein